ncbi:MAG: hypothetical protein GY926_03090 [bacterium]|nr:hypothetical protein [bacterium]
MLPRSLRRWAVLVTACAVIVACDGDTDVGQGPDADTPNERCDSAIAKQLAADAARQLGQPNITGWQEGLAGPNASRMPTADDLSTMTGFICQWEGSIPSADGEWIAASAAWFGEDLLGVVRLTHPPNTVIEDEGTYWFDQTGAITGAWVEPSMFAGYVDGDEPVAVLRSGTIEPPTAPGTSTTSTGAPVACPHVAPESLPDGIEGGPGTQAGVVWESAGVAPISISYTTNPDHPAASIDTAASIEFDGGSASYTSLRPDDPQPNFIARIDIAGAHPTCGLLTATFFSVGPEDVERLLSSLVVFYPATSSG